MEPTEPHAPQATQPPQPEKSVEEELLDDVKTLCGLQLKDLERLPLGGLDILPDYIKTVWGEAPHFANDPAVKSPLVRLRLELRSVLTSNSNDDSLMVRARKVTEIIDLLIGSNDTSGSADNAQSLESSVKVTKLDDFAPTVVDTPVLSPLQAESSSTSQEEPTDFQPTIPLPVVSEVSSAQIASEGGGITLEVSQPPNETVSRLQTDSKALGNPSITQATQASDPASFTESAQIEEAKSVDTEAIPVDDSLSQAASLSSLEVTTLKLEDDIKALYSIQKILSTVREGSKLEGDPYALLDAFLTPFTHSNEVSGAGKRILEGLAETHSEQVAQTKDLLRGISSSISSLSQSETAAIPDNLLSFLIRLDASLSDLFGDIYREAKQPEVKTPEKERKFGQVGKVLRSRYNSAKNRLALTTSAVTEKVKAKTAPLSSVVSDIKKRVLRGEKIGTPSRVEYAQKEGASPEAEKARASLVERFQKGVDWYDKLPKTVKRGASLLFLGAGAVGTYYGVPELAVTALAGKMVLRGAGAAVMGFGARGALKTLDAEGGRLSRLGNKHAGKIGFAVGLAALITISLSDVLDWFESSPLDIKPQVDELSPSLPPYEAPLPAAEAMSIPDISIQVPVEIGDTATSILSDISHGGLEGVLGKQFGVFQGLSDDAKKKFIENLLANIPKDSIRELGIPSGDFTRMIPGQDSFRFDKLAEIAKNATVFVHGQNVSLLERAFEVATGNR